MSNGFKVANANSAREKELVERKSPNQLRVLQEVKNVKKDGQFWDEVHYEYDTAMAGLQPWQIAAIEEENERNS